MSFDVAEPLSSDDLYKGVVIPRRDFEAWLRRFDWTHHQVARGEFPEPFQSLDEFQLAAICADPVLWVRCFLREPEDPDHKDPYGLWDYQAESLRYPGHTIHKCGSEVGKTREIVAYGLYKCFTTVNGSALIGAPQTTHLEEIIEAMMDQLSYNEELVSSLVRWKKVPHNQFKFTNRFRLDFRPSGHDGEAYRGIHARTSAIKDEAAKDKNVKQWSEFWRAMKPGCIAKIYSVPDGDRSCEFYKLGNRARGDMEAAELKDASRYVQSIKFKLFAWSKELMPPPYWTKERRDFYIDQYGGEDSPGYKHNVLGEDGDPEYSVFPWDQLSRCIKEIPEYRCLKILVDSGRDEVSVRGYRFELSPGDVPTPRAVTLIDTVYRRSTFFEAVKNKIPSHLRGEGEGAHSSLVTVLCIAVHCSHQALLPARARPQARRRGLRLLRGPHGVAEVKPADAMTDTGESVSFTPLRSNMTAHRELPGSRSRKGATAR